MYGCHPAIPELTACINITVTWALCVCIGGTCNVDNMLPSLFYTCKSCFLLPNYIVFMCRMSQMRFNLVVTVHELGASLDVCSYRSRTISKSYSSKTALVLEPILISEHRLMMMYSFEKRIYCWRIYIIKSCVTAETMHNLAHVDHCKLTSLQVSKSAS